MILGYLVIMFGRMADVTLGTIRNVFLIRGRRIKAAAIGFFEIIINVLMLSKVISVVQQPPYLIVYAIGFACGNYLGSLLEEKIALGNVNLQVVIGEGAETVIEKLRKLGLGVTVLQGYGKTGKKKVLNILAKRRDKEKIVELVQAVDTAAFITVTDVATSHGGYCNFMKKAGCFSGVQRNEVENNG